MDQPLAIAINASLYEFQFYKSGVLRESDGCSTYVNHAVVIVGYSEGSPSTTTEMVHNWWYTMEPTGEETDAPAVNEPGTWKIQNSWATSWGDDGFILFEVSAGAGVCGMNQYVYYVD